MLARSVSFCGMCLSVYPVFIKGWNDLAALRVSYAPSESSSIELKERLEGHLLIEQYFDRGVMEREQADIPLCIYRIEFPTVTVIERESGVRKQAEKNYYTTLQQQEVFFISHQKFFCFVWRDGLSMSGGLLCTYH